MKKITFVACLVFATHLINAQQSNVTSGGEATGSGGSASYTVSQIITTTNTGSNGSISHGVQQSIELYTLSNLEFTALTLTATTFPNPTADYIVLALKNSDLTDLSFVMFDLQGREVSKGNVQQVDTPIAMNKLAAGTYVLKVNQNKQELKTFKIIKK